MTPLKNELTEDQVRMMRKLVDALLYDKRITKDNFGMKHVGRRNNKHPSCTLGWGYRILDPHQFSKINVELSGSNKFRWMYSCDWAEIDNTKEGAAGRILYALEVGVPEPSRFLFQSFWDGGRHAYGGKEVEKGYKYPKRLQNWLEKVRKQKESL